MGTTGDAQSPTLTTSATAARATGRAASPSPAPAPAPAPAPGPSVSPPPPSFRRGKWHQAEYEEVWRLGHTYILTLPSSSSSSPPSPSPSSSIATAPPSTAGGTGAGSVQDWQNLRLHPEGLMKTQARQRSASALRSMFLKMRKESFLQQATAATTTTTEHPQIRKGETGGDPSSALRVRFKPVSFGPSQPTAGVGTTTSTPAVTSSSTSASSHATAAAADTRTSSPSTEVEEEDDKDQGKKKKKRERRRSKSDSSWTPAEDAVLLAAMITLPNTAAVVSSSAAAAPPPPSSQISTPAAGGDGKEDQVAAKESESAKKEEDEIEEASTPLARAAAWPPTTITTISTTTSSSTTFRDPHQQSQVASRSTTTATAGATGAGAETATNSLTTSAGWLKVYEIAERTYRIMEAGTAVQAGEAQGGGGARRLRRDVKELENRWRRNGASMGLPRTVSLFAAPELLLPAIRQQSDALSKLSVDVLTELSSRSQREGVTAAAVAADDSSLQSGSSASTKPAPFVVQQPEPSAPITRSDSERGDASKEEKKPLSQEQEDDPRAAYPTPAPGHEALPQNEDVVDYERDDPGLRESDKVDEVQHSVTTPTTPTPYLLEPAPPPASNPLAPHDAQVQDRQLFPTPAAPRPAAAPADVNNNKKMMIGLGLDFGSRIGTGIGLGQVQQQPQAQPPLYNNNNNSAIPTATSTGTQELDPDRSGVRLTTMTTIPLRRASSSAVLTSPSPSPLPATVIPPYQNPILSTNRGASTSFAPFTELYKPLSNVDGLRRAHQSQSQPQPQSPAPFQMYFQPKPRPLMPFSVEPPPQQQPVSPSQHSLQSSSSAPMSYRPFSRVLTTPTTMTTTTDPSPPSSSSHRDMMIMQHGSLASSASPSLRGRSSLGTVQEEGLSPRPPQNVEQPPDQPPQVRPLLPTTSSSGGVDDPDRHHDRGTKRRWSEADLYARSPIYAHETSLGPPQQQHRASTTTTTTTTRSPWTFGTGLAGGPMDQPNALDRAIAAGRPLADYSSGFDQGGGENDQDQDRDGALTHQHAERKHEG